MLRDIHFLVVGNILLTIGLIGYFMSNPFLAYLSLVLAVVFFVRQLVKTDTSMGEWNKQSVPVSDDSRTL